MLDLSIVIVNWNTKDLLSNCIVSIYESIQTICFEIIVVDNQSTDSSLDTIRNCYPEVRLIAMDKNLGFAGANNIGIMNSSGRYIALINSDTLILNRCFELLIHSMDQQKDIGLIAPRIFNYDLSLQKSCRQLPTLYSMLCIAFSFHQIPLLKKYIKKPFMSVQEHFLRNDIEVASGCFWFFRRDCFRSVGLLDERFFMYGEDIDLCKRIIDKKWKIAYDPIGESIHYGGKSSSLSPIKFYIEMQRSMCIYWDKHYSKLNTILYQIVQLMHHINRIFIRLIIQLHYWNDSKKQNIYKMNRSFQCIKWIVKNIIPKKV